MNANSHTSASVVTALGMTSWEPEFIAALRHPSVGLIVQRRCFEVVDLLAFLTASDVDGVVVGQDLVGLDVEVIAQVHAAGSWLIALVADETYAQWVTAAGADAVVFIDAEHPAAAARSAGQSARALIEPVAHALPEASALGRLVCVWGPPGSAGRSTVALALADECARHGLSTALVDADPVAPSLDQLLGLTGVGASVTWAQRQAAQGQLTRRVLLEAMPMTRSGVRVLPGSAGGTVLRPHLWPAVLTELRSAAQVVVVDLGAHINFDSVDPDDMHVLAALTCDELVTVGSCDPVGLSRLIRFLEGVSAAARTTQSQDLLHPPLATPRHTVAVTHVPAADIAVTAFLRGHVASRIQVLHGDLAFVDDDPRTCRAARARGQTLAECAPKSQIRRDLRALAAQVSQRAA